MANSDYHAAMLNLYFKEKRFSEKEKTRLLETNPFGRDYIEWEKNTLYNNRTFATLVKKYGLIKPDFKVRELVVHEDVCVSKSLFNDTQYFIIDPTKPLHADFSSDRLMLIKGLYEKEELFLNKLIFYHIPFVIGTTSSLPSFNEEKQIFSEFADKYDLYKVEEQSFKNRSILLKSNY